MLLMTATEAALAIGAKCGGASPTTDDPQLLLLLGALTGRLEEALNVSSLTRGLFLDHFKLVDMPPYSGSWSAADREVSLRLSNGFVQKETIVVTDPNGDEVDLGEYKGVDASKGIITLKSWIRGTYQVEYVSGFEPEALPVSPPVGYDPETRVLQNIPAWMKGIVVHFLVLWFRTTQIQPKGNKDISFGATMDSLRRDTYAWVYGKYQRPRANCVFADAREF